MIRKENLEDMIKAIGFVAGSGKKVFEKRYPEFDCKQAVMKLSSTFDSGETVN